MTPRRSIHGQIAKSVFIKNKGKLVTGIELSQLLSRLLFFDEVIISSVRMGELPFLIKSFGVDGFAELIQNGIVKLSSDSVSVITNIQRNGKRELPLFEFEQGIVDIADREKLIVDGLRSLQQVSGLSNANRAELSELVTKRVLKPGSDYGPNLLAQIRIDLRSNSKLISAILAKEHAELRGKEITVNLEELKPGVQRITTNIQQLIGVNSDVEHAMLEKAIIGVSKLNQIIANMKEYNALTLLEEGDVDALFGKVEGVVAPYNPKLEEDKFLRVLEFTEIPDLLNTGKIDTAKLLEIRESTECREFRGWLSSTDQLDDAQLNKLINGLRARAGAFIATPKGKAIRLAVSAGLGLIPPPHGPVIALAEGALDMFLLEKLLPAPGPLSFLTRTVPSILS